MPLYMARFSYRSEVWAGLVQSPENREERVREILAQAGSTLHGLWYAFGEDDGFALVEGPDNVTAAAFAVAITASGAFSRFTTTPLLSQEETLRALEKAASISYAAPPTRDPTHA